MHEPVLRELARRDAPFIGLLYAGLMLTEAGPRVLEFNCRFGDPETQAILPGVEGDLLGALAAAAAGDLDGATLAASDEAAVTIVLASRDYPAAGDVGSPITGIAEAEADGAVVFHAGTALRGDQLVTNGGRILDVSATGSTLARGARPGIRSGRTDPLRRDALPHATSRSRQRTGHRLAEAPVVGILVGSESDRERMQGAFDELDKRGIAYEFDVRSAHRTPDSVAEYARTARERGLRVLICGAGLAAALPGVVAAHTDLPVIGVPLRSSLSVLDGLDALLAIAQMPPGVPVAAVGVDSAKNAAVLAARILGA